MAEYTIENYRLNPADGSFSRIASYVTPKSGIEFFKKLNGYGKMTFSLDVHDPILNPDNFKLYRNNFLIKRNGVPVWLGPLTGYDANMEEARGTVEVQAHEYFYHLNARQTEQSYQKVNTAAGAVAWDLINTVQSRTNGNLGIVQGGIEAIDAIDETLEYAEVDEAIINLSDNISSFDFYLDPTLNANRLLSTVRFNVVKSRSRTIVNKKITHDQILSISSSTERDMYNTTTGLAYGSGDTVLTAVSEDSAAQLGYSRRERVVKLADYRIQDNLDAAIEEINSQSKVQTNYLNITLDPAGKFTYDQIELGDVITVDFRSSEMPPILRLYGTVRVYEINVKVDQNGVEYITPKVKFI